MPDTTNLAHLPMRRVLELFPGAQRALFRRHHIGGCSHCGFQPGETLEEVCRRNQVDVNEAIAHIQTSHKQDAALLMPAADLSEWMREGKPLRLLDVRSRTEFESGHIPGAVLMSKEIMQEMLANWPRAERLVICDQRGAQSLDAAAYFIGQGFQDVRALAGGLETWDHLETTASPAPPQNFGKLEDADAEGAAGSGQCGDMVRLWLKFRDESGRRVIDQASFEAFGCETAIALAGRITELIRGKTAEEAMAAAQSDLASELDPHLPMKIHCGQLVEGALQNALNPSGAEPVQGRERTSPGLVDKFTGGSME